MTEKQRNFIKYLDYQCVISGVKRSSHDEDMLGEDWELYFKNFTPSYTDEVINKLKEALGMPITEKPKRKRKK